MADFGVDKALWVDHIKEAHIGVGEDILKALKNVCEPDNQSNEDVDPTSGEHRK